MASPGLLYELFQFVRTREGPNPASRDALSEKRSPHGRRWTERRPPDRMINLAALFVLSPTRPSSTSSRRLQARPEPFTSPCATRCPPPAFRHPAHASLCFAFRFKGLQAGSLRRLPGAKPLSQMLLGACWCTIACVPSHCAQRHDAVLVLRLWLLPRPGCKEGAGGTLPPAVLVRAFVSGRVVRAVMRVWAGSQPLRDLSPCGFVQFGSSLSRGTRLYAVRSPL